MVKFKYEAKDTHKIYGTNNQAAFLLIFPKEIIVARINIHKTMISPKANQKLPMPKKKTDHKMFNTIWAENILRAQRTLLLIFDDQTRYRAIPIRINKVVQTGPNSQDGGFHEGLLITRYQVLTAGPVNREPSTPANKGTEIDIASFPMLIFFIYPVYL